MRIDNEVLDVLRDGLRADDEGRTVVIEQQLDRKLYTKTNEVLEALGGKWNRKAKAHLFPEPPLAALTAALALGEVTTARDLGYFPSPPPVVRQLLELAGVGPGHHVLEPSAGEGAIVEALLDMGAKVTAIECDAGRAKRLAQKLWKKPGLALHVADLLTWGGDVAAPVDAVAMNPPFIDHLGHVQRAFTFLRPGGVLVSVLPTSVEWRKDKKHDAFRAWLASLPSASFHELPEDAFRSSGTSVRTCILRLQKRV